MTANKITLDVCIINDEQISVLGASTSFFSEHFTPRIDVPALIKRHNKLVKAARAKGIKVSLKQGYKKRLQAVEQAYDIAQQDYERQYEEFKELVIEKVANGITSPTCDDKELALLSTLRRRLHDFFKGDQPIPMVREAEARIRDMEWEVYRENCSLISFTL